MPVRYETGKPLKYQLMVICKKELYLLHYPPPLGDARHLYAGQKDNHTRDLPRHVRQSP